MTERVRVGLLELKLDVDKISIAAMIGDDAMIAFACRKGVGRIALIRELAREDEVDVEPELMHVERWLNATHAEVLAPL